MAIATFSPPIKATAELDGLPRILLAVAESDEGSVPPYLIAVDGEGTIELLPITDVKVDWRYDPKTELWSDIQGAPETPFGDSDA